MNKCGVIKDLLPLYADEMCSTDSKELVEEHIAYCEDCKRELEDYSYNTGLPAVKADEAFKSFKKRMSVKTIVTVAVCLVLSLALVFGVYYVMFEQLYVAEYSPDLLKVETTEDGGIRVDVNADNYLRMEVWDYIDSDGSTDIYLTVVDNNYTKMTADDDTSDHYWFTNNASAICAQSGDYSPIGGDDPNYKVKNIYYFEINPKVLYRTPGSIKEKLGDTKPQLIWSAPEE